jgi:hypothetical protein
VIPEFELLRQRQMRELRAQGPGDGAAWLEASRALRLFGTIGSEAVLHPDGTVVIYDYDDWSTDGSPGYTIATAAEGGERIASLVLGAEQMPELAAMLPARPDGAFDCGVCEGSGRWPKTEDNRGIICPVCYGLRWVETDRQPALDEHSRVWPGDEQQHTWESFWTDLVDDVSRHHGEPGEWEPWGVQLRVGDPMPRRLRPALHVRSARLGRSIKIEHLTGDPPIPLRAATHHVRIYHDADRVWEHTDELVLTLSIPEVVADAVRQLVMAWSDPSTSPEEIS